MNESKSIRFKFVSFYETIFPTEKEKKKKENPNTAKIFENFSLVTIYVHVKSTLQSKGKGKEKEVVI